MVRPVPRLADVGLVWVAAVKANQRMLPHKEQSWATASGRVWGNPVGQEEFREPLFPIPLCESPEGLLGGSHHPLPLAVRSWMKRRT